MPNGRWKNSGLPWTPVSGGGFGPGTDPRAPGGRTMPTMGNGGLGYESSPPIPAPWDNAQPGAGGGGGVLGDVWGWIKKNPEMILAGLSAIQGARRQGKADDLREEAIAFAREQDARREPFRAAVGSQLFGEDGALKPMAAAPDFSDVFADAGNPFARRKSDVLKRALG